MLAFSIDYYGVLFRATQSVELFCTYVQIAIEPDKPPAELMFLNKINVLFSYYLSILRYLGNDSVKTLYTYIKQHSTNHTAQGVIEKIR